MKEIDFLPEWYKSCQRREFGYRTQYVALGGMFVVMMVWNFVSLNSVSKATAELAEMASRQAQAQNLSKEFARFTSEVEELQKKASTIEKIDSKIDVASVLAEISFLVNEDIVLSRVEFVAERFADEMEGKRPGGSVVRVARATASKQRNLPLGDVRYKVIINGVAADASDVAEMICKLEESLYFCLVYPAYSRNRIIAVVTDRSVSNSTETSRNSSDDRETAASAESNYQVSEFEISCYLANYRQDSS